MSVSQWSFLFRTLAGREISFFPIVLPRHIDLYSGLLAIYFPARFLRLILQHFVFLDIALSIMSDPPCRVCVFCSTTSGHSPSHLAAARSLAEVMHTYGIQLVYGGGTTGMMGELAKSLVALSGPDSVHGIIPRDYLSLERPHGAKEYEHQAEKGQKNKALLWCKALVFRAEKQKAESSLLSEEKYGRITIVEDVQVRKKMMAREVATGGKGSGFIGLSGGFGTMDELVEMVTWNQLGVHNKKVCLFNVDGFWNGVLDWMENAIRAGFVRETGRNLLVAKETAEDCIKHLQERQVKGHLQENNGVM